MIGIGILLILGGGLCCYNGYEQNNDWEVRLSSFLNTGNSAPGNTYYFIGGLLVVCGIILVAVGILKASQEKGKEYVHLCPACGNIFTSGVPKPTKCNVCKSGNVTYTGFTKSEWIMMSKEDRDNFLKQYIQKK